MATTIDGSASVTINSGAVLGITSGTALSYTQATNSGTTLDFTGIPSWVKRITVMFNGVSTNGTALIQIQVGAGSVTTSGYVGTSGRFFSSNQAFADAATTGFTLDSSAASNVFYGSLVLTNVSGNTWVASGTFSNSVTTALIVSTAGGIALGGVLDRVRITTVGSPATDTFDAGTVNILYE